MLNLILGRQLSGKTKYCTDKASELANDNKQVIMLVPEQYNFECQKLLLEELGPSVSNKIEIHSFTSLCKLICAQIGGISGINVDEGIRFLLIGKALENVRDNLKHYARYVNSRDFQLKMAALVNELKQSSVSSEDLRTLTEKADSSVFKDKLFDVSLILSAYDALLGRHFVEPHDIIDKTVLRMHGSDFFKGKTVIIDEFKGFTESQKKLLDRIVAGCDNVYAAFCCDSEIPHSETDVFKNVIKSVNDLKEIAAKNGVACAKTVVLEHSGYVSDELKHLELISAQKLVGKFDGEPQNLCVCRAATVYDEIDFVMNSIRRLVRENGYRYADFVIISRKTDVYTSLISDISEKYNIPCLTDSRINMRDLPLTIYALSAVKSALSFDTEDILRHLKTGFSDVSLSDIPLLENYAFIWSINGKKWLQPWCLNPDGLKENYANESFENKNLNALRESAIKPINELRFSLKGNVTDMCTAVYKLISSETTVKKLKDFTSELEKSGRLDEAEHQRAGYDVLIKALDKLCAVSGEESVSPERFAEMLETALSFETVGEIPRTKDQVIYGAADRIRPMRPKVCFVIGANHDVFPLSVGMPDIFSVSERALMNDNGIKLNSFDIDDTLDEKFLYYYCVNCACERVYLSYSANSADGEELLPSEETETIIKAFPNLCEIACGFSKQLDMSQVEAALPSFEKMAVNYGCGDVSMALQNYFGGDERFSDKLNALSRAAISAEPKLSATVARGLYGENLRLSPSKIDDYNKCSFAFFCKFGLKARKLDKVDFNAATRGNIVHFCLEHFINNHKDDIGALDEKAAYNEAIDICDKYLAMLGVSVEDVGDKFDYMLSLLKKTAAYIAVALNREFAQSGFRPKFCELKIGKEQLVQPLTFTADNGVKISVEGTVDRVDTTNDGKVRVVDYKTGIKDFKLSQVLDGMNYQMLLYLYSLVQNAKELLKADVPAGILYFPARKNISDGAADRFIKMNGLIDSDVDTVKQMEASGEGKIVPAHLRPNGNGFYSTESVVSVSEFEIIFKYLDKTIAEIGAKITNGNISRLPYKNSHSISCDYCDYRSVCRLNDETRFREEVKMKTANALELMCDHSEEEGE